MEPKFIPSAPSGRCPVCREWVIEGCEHFDNDGNVKSEHQAEVERLAKIEAELEAHNPMAKRAYFTEWDH